MYLETWEAKFSKENGRRQWRSKRKRERRTHNIAGTAGKLGLKHVQVFNNCSQVPRIKDMQGEVQKVKISEKNQWF